LPGGPGVVRASADPEGKPERQRPEEAEQAHDKEINLNLQLRLSFCLTTNPAAVRSVTMSCALRSAMFGAAGMSRSRAPRS
jgi:hypothetical protein